MTTQQSNSRLPILYSFRRCPYAMRARMALYASEHTVELREVVLKNKPASLLACSPKGTVPVLIVSDQHIIAESRDIIDWTLEKQDLQEWLSSLTADQRLELNQLITENDAEFKGNLDRYKYPNRYLTPENNNDQDPTAVDYEHYSLGARQSAEIFLQSLEQRLNHHSFLLGDKASMADIAIFPFIRQFAHVDKVWFDQAPYPALQQWLAYWLSSPIFQAIMKKYTPWQPDAEPLYFGQLHFEP